MEKGIFSQLKLCLSVILLISVKEISSQCQDFDEIPEAEYDRTYSTISETDARPLGFMHGRVLDNGDPLCINAVGVSDGRAVEIAYESVPSATLCVRRNDIDIGCNTKGSHCEAATNDPTKIEFFVSTESGSSEGDVNFWYRVRTGLPAVNDTEQLWCQQQSVSYPQSLAPLPSFVTVPPTTPISASVKVTATSLAATLATVIIAVFLLA